MVNTKNALMSGNLGRGEIQRVDINIDQKAYLGRGEIQHRASVATM